jgi:hypothetical protein
LFVRFAAARREEASFSGQQFSSLRRWRAIFREAGMKAESVAEGKVSRDQMQAG